MHVYPLIPYDNTVFEGISIHNLNMDGSSIMIMIVLVYNRLCIIYKSKSDSNMDADPDRYQSDY